MLNGEDEDAVNIKLKPWMAWAVTASVAFNVSYWMAAHFPECGPKCRDGDISFTQFWYGLVSTLLLFAAIGFVVAAFQKYLQKHRES